MTSSERREFLRYLAASPLLVAAGLTPAWLERMFAQSVTSGTTPAPVGRAALAAPPGQVVIKSVKDALSVFDFEAAARAKLSEAHFTWISVGTFREETLQANRDAFTKIQLRIRRLTGLTPSSIDQSIEVFGRKYRIPVFTCPVGGLNGYDPQGNVTVARATKTRGALQIVSSSTQQSYEEIVAARGEPVWFQVGGGRPASPGLIKRLESAGCEVLVWTVDGVPGADQVDAVTFQRLGVADRETDTRCIGCHGVPPPRPMAEPRGSAPAGPAAPPTWPDVRRLRDMTKMRLVIKGIATREDAELAVQNGADGVLLSTHGGHVDASGRASIESLADTVAAVGSKVPVLIDSGFRSGADVFKALALGARAVGVGRPYVWGLGSFGQEGVETVLELLARELQIVMIQTNAPSIAKIDRSSIISRL
jgi:isopentenyl diphosphate isomerase/L-lactate dehydrogenase-like FMN-dependent dehydrogenase